MGMRVQFSVSIGGCRGDGTFIPDTTDVSVSKAGEFHGTVCCEEHGFQPDIAVGGAVLVQEG
jgi:hypothetical protein